MNEKKEMKDFRMYSISCILFALLFTICYYKNSMGITTPVFYLGTLAFMERNRRKLEIPFKPKTIPICIALALTGISGFFTANLNIHLCSSFFYAFYVLLLMIMHVYDTTNWNVLDYLSGLAHMLMAGLEALPNLFTDCKAYRSYQKEESGKKSILENPNVRTAIVSFLCGIPVMLIMLCLLASSDAVFSGILGALLNSLFDTQIFVNGILFLFLFFVMLIVSYGYLTGCSNQIGHSRSPKEAKNYNPIAILIFGGDLVIVYFIYSVVQIGALFLGKMALPDGYTYSQYAREGFYQLLLVCLFNFFLVIGSHLLFAKSKLANVILTLITACTYIMIASAAFRMGMYVEAYGLTTKRVLVFWTLAILVVLFAGLEVVIWNPRFPYFLFATGVLSVFYLGLAFSHMDYWIAYYDLFYRNPEDFVTSSSERESDAYDENADYDRIYRENTYDTVGLRYLEQKLSIDATPVIVAYYQQHPSEYSNRLEDYKSYIEEKGNLNIYGRGFHFSKLWALKALDSVNDSNSQ